MASLRLQVLCASGRELQKDQMWLQMDTAVPPGKHSFYVTAHSREVTQQKLCLKSAGTKALLQAELLQVRPLQHRVSFCQLWTPFQRPLEGRVWWCKPAIPAQGRLRQEVRCKFKTSLAYKASPRPASTAWWHPASKRQNKLSTWCSFPETLREPANKQ